MIRLQTRPWVRKYLRRHSAALDLEFNVELPAKNLQHPGHGRDPAIGPAKRHFDGVEHLIPKNL